MMGREIYYIYMSSIVSLLSLFCLSVKCFTLQLIDSPYSFYNIGSGTLKMSVRSNEQNVLIRCVVSPIIILDSC